MLNLRDTYTQGKLNAGCETIKSTYRSYPLDMVGQQLYIDQWGRWFFLQDIPAAGLYHGLLRSDGVEKRSWSAYRALGWFPFLVTGGEYYDDASA